MQKKVLTERYDAIEKIIRGRSAPITVDEIACRIIGRDLSQSLVASEKLLFLEEKRKVQGSMAVVSKMVMLKGHVLANVRSRENRAGGYYIGDTNAAVLELDKSCKRAIGLIKMAKNRANTWLLNGIVNKEQHQHVLDVIKHNSIQLKDVISKSDNSLEDDYSDDYEPDSLYEDQMNQVSAPSFTLTAANEKVSVSAELMG